MAQESSNNVGKYIKIALALAFAAFVGYTVYEMATSGEHIEISGGH